MNYKEIKLVAILQKMKLFSPPLRHTERRHAIGERRGRIVRRRVHWCWQHCGRSSCCWIWKRGTRDREGRGRVTAIQHGVGKSTQTGVWEQRGIASTLVRICWQGRTFYRYIWGASWWFTTASCLWMFRSACFWEARHFWSVIHPRRTRRVHCLQSKHHSHNVTVDGILCAYSITAITVGRRFRVGDMLPRRAVPLVVRGDTELNIDDCRPNMLEEGMLYVEAPGIVPELKEEL